MVCLGDPGYVLMSTLKGRSATHGPERRERFQVHVSICRFGGNDWKKRLFSKMAEENLPVGKRIHIFM